MQWVCLLIMVFVLVYYYGYVILKMIDTFSIINLYMCTYNDYKKYSHILFYHVLYFAKK